MAKHRFLGLVGVTCALGLVLAGAGPALADTQRRGDELSSAAARINTVVPEHLATSAGEHGMPQQGSETIDRDGLSLGIPATGVGVTREGNAVYEGNADQTKVVAQSTESGFRSLVFLESKNAPERFDFPVKNATALKLLPNGAVQAGSGEKVLGLFTPPWAQDAHGAAVPTHYEVQGNVLTQIVEHRSGNYAYGIVADPSWLQHQVSVGAGKATELILSKTLPGLAPYADKIGHCVTGALDALWDGADALGTLKGCVAALNIGTVDLGITWEDIFQAIKAVLGKFGIKI